VSPNRTNSFGLRPEVFDASICRSVRPSFVVRRRKSGCVEARHRKMPRLMIPLASVVSAVVAATAAAPLLERGRVQFTAHGPAGLTIEGNSAALSLSADPETLSFSLPLATLRTGSELRDKHMQDDLDVKSYPTAELRIERSRLQLPSVGTQLNATCPAKLTLHGRTRDVSLVYQAKGGDGYDVSGSFGLDLRDYGIEPPKYLGVAIKPDVQVSATFHLVLP
jgi:polyisoprenoid-binding protein YceI